MECGVNPEAGRRGKYPLGDHENGRGREKRRKGGAERGLASSCVFGILILDGRAASHRDGKSGHAHRLSKGPLQADDKAARRDEDEVPGI